MHKTVCVISHAQSPVFIGIWVFQDKCILLFTTFLFLRDCTVIAFHIIKMIYFLVASLWKCDCFWNNTEPNGLGIWPRVSLWSSVQWQFPKLLYCTSFPKAFSLQGNTSSFDLRPCHCISFWQCFVTCYEYGGTFHLWFCLRPWCSILLKISLWLHRGMQNLQSL